MFSLFLSAGPLVHRSDYTYRGGYHYHYQPPRIPPPVVYRPIPLSPPATYYRPSVPMPPYHHRFTGPVVPQMHHIYKGLSPPIAHHQHQRVKGPFVYKVKGPCPTKSEPTVRTTPVVHLPTILPTLPEPTVPPALPSTTVAPLTTVEPVVVTTVHLVETTAPVTLPVSTQSGFTSTVSPVETGRILSVRFDFPLNHYSSNLSRSYRFVLLWQMIEILQEPLKNNLENTLIVFRWDKCRWFKWIKLFCKTLLSNSKNIRNIPFHSHKTAICIFTLQLLYTYNL